MVNHISDGARTYRSPLNLLQQLVVNTSAFPLYPEGVLVVSTAQEYRSIARKAHAAFAQDLCTYIEQLPEKCVESYRVHELRLVRRPTVKPPIPCGSRTSMARGFPTTCTSLTPAVLLPLLFSTLSGTTAHRS
jgi:hypothetical protein